jgi:Uma2 family endonuclease
MSLAQRLLMSAEEYLASEEASITKNEFLNGEIWAMAGASDAHVTIAGNLFVLLRQQLKGSSCKVFISDMKVKLVSSNAFFYPDVLVSCDLRDQKNTLFKEHPLFIAEVLSPSTEAFDRGKKFTFYRQLPSLKYYWLIDSQSKSIDCFERAENNDWLLHSVSESKQVLRLDDLQGEFGVEAIYEGVDLESIDEFPIA